jgi:putative Mn2+ efflux pump MntP
VKSTYAFHVLFSVLGAMLGALLAWYAFVKGCDPWCATILLVCLPFVGLRIGYWIAERIEKMG